MTRIGIVGNGAVGSALAAAYTSKGCEVLVHDIVSERSTHDLDSVLATDFVMVCLPTPRKPYNGEADTSFINQFLTQTAVIRRNANLVLRSTVPVGFTRGAAAYYGLPNLVHSPEFLTMRTAVEDATNPVRWAIGSPNVLDWDDRYSLACKLSDFYEDVHSNALPTHCSSDESETIKLFQNAFSAVKVSVFNEFREFCDKRNLDWNDIRTALLDGGWINPMHTQVPGPDGKYGYGGACLPKDISNLVMCMHEAGVIPTMLQASIERNKRDRPMEE